MSLRYLSSLSRLESGAQPRGRKCPRTACPGEVSWGSALPASASRLSVSVSIDPLRLGTGLTHLSVPSLSLGVSGAQLDLLTKWVNE